MTKYEVKDKLSEYYNLHREAESIKKRIENLSTVSPLTNEVKARLEELNEFYNKTILSTDIALASALKLINKLDNTDYDADVLKKFHIDGLSERIIAKQLCLAVNYIKTKRWRAYNKISKRLKEKPLET